MVNTEEQETIAQLEENIESILKTLSRIVKNPGYLGNHFRCDITDKKTLQDLRELQKLLRESLKLTECITDKRVSRYVTSHRNYVDKALPELQKTIQEMSTENKFLAGRFPRDLFFRSIPENLKTILAIIRMPKQEEPFSFSLSISPPKNDDQITSSLIRELNSIDNTEIISQDDAATNFVCGAAGPLFDFVTVVTFISVAANIATLSDVLRRSLKKGDKQDRVPQVRIKTSKGEILLNDVPAKELVKILQSIKEPVEMEKSKGP